MISVLRFIWFPVFFIGLPSLINPGYTQVRGPLIEQNPNPEYCIYPNDELSGTVVLESNCYYEQAFKVESPNTTVDCNGAELRGLIDGEDEYNGIVKCKNKCF